MKLSPTNIGLVVGLLAACGLIVFLLAQPRSEPESNNFPPVAADDYTKGAATSTVVLVEYLDFECEACGAYYPIVKSLEKQFGEEITFVARYFPLPGHRNGLPAALAAEAAGRQGKFWEMHDLLFERQKEWGEKQVPTPEVFEGFAAELGLDMDKFRADVASPEVKARVQRDMDAGRALGVNSTPSFFLNGERLQNPQSEQQFWKILETAVDGK